MSAELILVGIHIGHPDDISHRALDILRGVDIIACEEAPFARRFLSTLGIDKELIEVNEHTEKEAASLILAEIGAGKRVALISDCGMPVFADPGAHLVSMALTAGIVVDVVPGPDSLTTALAISGFDAHRFFFYGFLSPKKDTRKRELVSLRGMQVPLVFLDAPYRLSQVLQDMLTVFGPRRRCCVAGDLTLPEQLVVRGTLDQVCKRFADDRTKREFVIIIAPPQQHSGEARSTPSDRTAVYRRRRKP